MRHFTYQQNELYIEDVRVADIATQFGTPCYVYSRQTLEQNWQAFDTAFQGRSHRICYAVKANSNLAVLNCLARLGSGFDIVSIGELERVLAAKGDPSKIVFSGVGKKPAEILRAIEVGVFCFNVESEPELERIYTIAKQHNKIISIALRINPNIDAGTHPYIATGLHENKFGIEVKNALLLCQKIKSNYLSHIKLIGIACHIGSQITELSPFAEALDRLLELIEKLKQDNIMIEHLNIGGGLGVNYQDETPPAISDYVAMLCKHLQHCPLEIILEPGRSIVANAGILLTKVEYLKHTDHKDFAIVDAAMNDLMRPALYDAWQRIMPVSPHTTLPEKTYDIVGPVCESADFLGKERKLALQPDDLLAIGSAGAYGFSMSSNYNSRPRVAEIMVDGKTMQLVRRREKIEELFLQESFYEFSPL